MDGQAVQLGGGGFPWTPSFSVDTKIIETNREIVLWFTFRGRSAGEDFLVVSIMSYYL